MKTPYGAIVVVVGAFLRSIRLDYLKQSSIWTTHSSYTLIPKQRNAANESQAEKIAATICESWNDFDITNNAALILNGDSANLPIPDESVDFVVTDPPYFDFIHYSELSDFFLCLARTAFERYILFFLAAIHLGETMKYSKQMLGHFRCYWEGYSKNPIGC